ncbi:MAG: hypothetical protein KC613_08560, partial [Myxococcales bacterium]|nr:hypothetical protein [Myxococcales bacterium]
MTPGGYRWWYLDVLDPERGLGLTAIVFIGSVFSPRYFAARRRGQATAKTPDPMDFCAVNLVLHGPSGGRFVMTEVPRAAVDRGADHLTVGGTTVRWAGDTLRVDFAERAAPFGQRVEGRVELRPRHLFGPRVDLSGDGAHTWSPIAPLADATVTLRHPEATFSGPAYHDMNWGDAPLEQHFARWHWARARQPDGATVIYDTDRRDGSHGRVGLRFDADGTHRPVEVPEAVALPPTGWRLPRPTRAPAGARVAVAQTLLDAPFYNRSALTVTPADCAPFPAVHEYLDLDRFGAGWVRRPYLGTLPWVMIFAVAGLG